MDTKANDPLTLIQSLTEAEVRARLYELAGEERQLRTLLNSIRRREREVLRRKERGELARVR
jgi:hypothetical protein